MLGDALFLLSLLLGVQRQLHGLAHFTGGVRVQRGFLVHQSPRVRLVRLARLFCGGGKVEFFGEVPQIDEKKGQEGSAAEEKFESLPLIEGHVVGSSRRASTERGVRRSS